MWSTPRYQLGIVARSVARGHRAVPDVAMDADPQTGMLIGQTQTFPDGSVRYSEHRTGGTSLASPLMAAVEAIADQAAGRPHGFLNPALYRLAGSGALRDVAPGSAARAVVRMDYANQVDGSAGLKVTLRSLDDEAQSLHLGVGWDTLTGLGSPNGGAFVAALAGAGR